MPTDSPLSRRDFLAASAIGALGIARGAAADLDEEPQPAGQLLYVGTYTDPGRAEGVFLVRMDPRTGALRQVGARDVGPNPSFLAIHPNGRTLYAVNEVTELAGEQSGSVTSFAIAPGTGRLARLEERFSEGGAPCYVSVDPQGRFVFVANYVGGSVAVLPVGRDGALLPATHVVQHSGTGPNAERQEAAHAHCIIPDRRGTFAVAADLGTDRVMVYRLDRERGSLVQAAPAPGPSTTATPVSGAAMRPGAGPRHLAFHPTLPFLFVANELDSTVTRMRWDAATGKLTVEESASTLPAGATGKSQVADIHIAPSGRTLYVSNRGHDSIAVLSVAPGTGALAPLEVVPTGGAWPRNFSLDPTGRWLLVANQNSDSIVVFARDPESGRLTSTAHRLTVPKPVCLRFLAHAGTTT
jgi:6-phosphogluconolactonase